MKADNIQELSPLVLKVNYINLRLLYHARKQMKRTVYDTSYVKTITTGTEENMEKVKSLSEHYVIRNAKRASKLIEDMKKKTEKEKVDKKRINYFISQLKDIIGFYESITAPKKSAAVREDLIGYYKTTQHFYNDIDKILANLNSDLSQLNSELGKLPADNSKENCMKKHSLELQIHFTSSSIQILNTFKSCYSNLMPTLDKVKSDVDYFILALTESVKVYKKAVQVAELSQTITNAMDTINQLNELNNLSVQIAESWSHLESIMEQLSDIQQSIAA